VSVSFLLEWYKTIKNKKVPNKWDFFCGESRIDFVLPAKLRFENPSNKKTLKWTWRFS
jgi:hypothetical protein